MIYVIILVIIITTVYFNPRNAPTIFIVAVGRLFRQFGMEISIDHLKEVIKPNHRLF